MAAIFPRWPTFFPNNISTLRNVPWKFFEGQTWIRWEIINHHRTLKIHFPKRFTLSINHFSLFDFTSTHAISTPVKFSFLILHLLINVRNLPGDAHLLKRPRKSLKLDFRCSVLRKLVRVWFHFKWFWKLYNLSYSLSSFIPWGRNC